MLQWLYTYVAGSCSQCLSVFSNVCCKCVYLDVAYVFNMMSVFYLDIAYVYNGFKCFHVFLQVFQTHVSFVFRRMLHLLHLDISKLDWVLQLPPRLSAVSPRCQTQEGGGGPHVLACARNGRDVGGRHGMREGGSGAGSRQELASRRQLHPFPNKLAQKAGCLWAPSKD
jgi:hypothetical protein